MHQLSFNFHPLGFQARCTCGWRGAARTVEGAAIADADAHETAGIVGDVVAVAQDSAAERVARWGRLAGDTELAGPGSETADEYRRRVI